MQEAKKIVSQHTSPVAGFLLNGNDYHQVVYEVGASTTVEKLEAAYANHCRYVLKFPQAECKLGEDRHHFTAAGFLVKKNNVCKSCDANPASKKTCGAHYLKGKNRPPI